MQPSHPNHSTARRDFLRKTAALTTLGGFPLIVACSDSKAQSDLLVERPDGRKRLPPGQKAARLDPAGQRAQNNQADSAPVDGPEPEVGEAAQASDPEAAPSDPADPSNVEEAPAPRVPEGTVDDPFYHDARARNADGELKSISERRPPGQNRPQAELTVMTPAPARGNASRERFRLRVHGEVDNSFELSFLDLLKLPQTEMVCDIHCVTEWSVLDVSWLGVTIKELADRAGVRRKVRHVIFEAQHGYTANVKLDEAMKPNGLVAHRLYGSALPGYHGGPVRNVIPDLYFWKSAKWLTGIKFVEDDVPGYWEVRGYHNHADPWLEERYSSQEPPGYREDY